MSIRVWGWIGIILALTVGSAVVMATWWRLTHHCAATDRIWVERSCIPMYNHIKIGDVDTLVYAGDSCTEAHYEDRCVKWEADN